MLSMRRSDFADASLSPAHSDSVYILKTRGSHSQIWQFSAPSFKGKLLGSLQKQKINAAIAGTNDGVAVLGGSDASETAAYSDCELVSYTNGSLSALPALTFPRTKSSAVSHLGFLYIIGGFLQVETEGKVEFRLSNSVEKLIPGNWVTLGVLFPIPIYRPSPVSVSERLFVAGGVTKGNVSNRCVFEVNFSAGEVVVVAESPYFLEESYPVLASEHRNALHFAFRRRADTRTSEFTLTVDSWQTRKWLLAARLKLQRLALI